MLIASFVKNNILALLHTVIFVENLMFFIRNKMFNFYQMVKFPVGKIIYF